MYHVLQHSENHCSATHCNTFRKMSQKHLLFLYRLASCFPATREGKAHSFT